MGGTQFQIAKPYPFHFITNRHNEEPGAYKYYDNKMKN